MSANSLDFLPQTGPARLITGVRESRGALACTARIPADSPFRSRDRSNANVSSVVAIEMAAQAAAALEPAPQQPTDHDPSRSSPRLLVGLRAVDLVAASLNADEEFCCHATPITTAGPLRIYRFEVRGPHGDLVASGELSTYFESASEPE